MTEVLDADGQRGRSDDETRSDDSEFARGKSDWHGAFRLANRTREERGRVLRLPCRGARGGRTRPISSRVRFANRKAPCQSDFPRANSESSERVTSSLRPR